MWDSATQSTPHCCFLALLLLLSLLSRPHPFLFYCSSIVPSLLFALHCCGKLNLQFDDASPPFPSRLPPALTTAPTRVLISSCAPDVPSSTTSDSQAPFHCPQRPFNTNQRLPHNAETLVAACSASFCLWDQLEFLYFLTFPPWRLCHRIIRLNFQRWPQAS